MDVLQNVPDEAVEEDSDDENTPVGRSPRNYRRGAARIGADIIGLERKIFTKRKRQRTRTPITNEEEV